MHLVEESLFGNYTGQDWLAVSKQMHILKPEQEPTIKENLCTGGKTVLGVVTGKCTIQVSADVGQSLSVVGYCQNKQHKHIYCRM